MAGSSNTIIILFVACFVFLLIAGGISAGLYFGNVFCPSWGNECSPGTPGACEVGDWGDWSSCSSKCGNGTQTRSRTVTSPGTSCPNLTETQYCDVYSGCSPCVYGSWDNWSPCDVTCGNGTQFHSSKLTPNNDNPSCMPTNQEFKDCSSYSGCSGPVTQYTAGSRGEGASCNSKRDCANPGYHKCDNGKCVYYND